MTAPIKRVLLVDDEEKLLHSIAQRMQVLGFAPLTATNGMAAIDIALKHPIDLAIVDLQMPDMNGLVTITKLKEIKPNLRTVLLTGHGNDKVKQATESLNTLYFEKDEMGDFWSFIKKINAEGNIVVIRPPTDNRGPRTGRSNPVAPQPLSEIETHARHDFDTAGHTVDVAAPAAPRPAHRERLRIVGETPAMQELQENIARVAPLDCTVLLSGEPGAGKELAARAIHAGSLRHRHRFLAINCATLANAQFAGQLLGHKSGDLSDAIHSRGGIFGSSQVGTLLFDQIEKMPHPLQDQLLNVLDRIDRQRSGDSNEARIHMRILMATDTDLSQLAAAESFSRALHDRLKLFELTIPPLRERRDDIAPLCWYFLDQYRRELGKAVDSIAPEVVNTLVNYDFPGNVGELRHIIERAVILADSKTIEPRHLPERFLGAPKSAPAQNIGNFPSLAQLEDRYIVEVLQATQGNKSKTAEILGISRAALWRKLKRLKTEQAGKQD